MQVARWRDERAKRIAVKHQALRDILPQADDKDLSWIARNVADSTFDRLLNALRSSITAQ